MTRKVEGYISVQTNEYPIPRLSDNQRSEPEEPRVYRARLADALDGLDVGFSLFTDVTEGGLNNHVTNFADRKGKRFCVRKQESGTRIWRVS